MRISDWSSDVCSSDLSQDRDRLYRAGDMTGREQAGKEMAGMAKRLERDPQVESILRNRTRELGLEIGLSRGGDMGGGELGRRLTQALGLDRQCLVAGTSVSIRFDLGGRRSLKKKNKRQ